jgi:NAD(P)-dependent dehydrogenase (short-subunit alcohol dehydrogenase family)
MRPAGSAPSVVLVTGAARGIGRGIANHFAQAGHFVVVTDIDEEEARACAAAIGPLACAMQMNAGCMTHGPFEQRHAPISKRWSTSTSRVSSTAFRR